MFYLKEIYFRLIFVCILILCLFLVFYRYKDITFIIFLLPSKIGGSILIEHFIYTHPAELLITLLNLNFFFVTLTAVPYVIWTTTDFLKTGLFKNEYKNLKEYFKTLSFLILSLNILIFVFTFPFIFKFFQSFNSFNKKDIQIKFELKVFDFICFTYNVFCIVNTCIIFIVVLFIVIAIKGVAFYIRYRKIFFLINIIAATFFSTPDVTSQITLFVLLVFILEVHKIIIFYMNKISMVTC